MTHPISNVNMAGMKHDQGKLRYDLCPPEWFEGLAEVMSYGATKYEPNSWQRVEVERYEAALMRHFQAWRKGEVLDAESGLPHLAHAAANSLILMSLTNK